MARAFSFAEILRDEYVYFHGQEPTAEATIDEKYLRELPRLILRARHADDPKPKPPAPPKDQPAAEWSVSRESFLKQQCKFPKDADGANDGETLKAVLRGLLKARTVDVAGTPMTLYEALLLDPDPNGVNCAQLRHRDVLCRLLRIRHARRFVFNDEKASELIAASDDLKAIFLADSAAIRLIDDPRATPGGRAILSRHPALLTTIADDAWLHQVLAGSPDARKRLVHLFRDRPWYTTVWPFSRSVTKEKDRRPDLSRDPRQLEEAITGQTSVIITANAPTAELTNFNAIVLQTAFPDHFLDSQDVRTLNAALHHHDMAALCLSGGGIRSATFNLGVLQGLADHGLLTKFHYLSTVSGGGYIGSWLSSWIRRHTHGLGGVAADLAAPSGNPENPELTPVEHLRDYSSYLAPRSASLSVDTWTLIATYLRNLLVNWTMLLPALAAVLVLPRIAEAAAHAARLAGRTNPGLSFRMSVLAILLGFVAIFAVTRRRLKQERKSARSLPEREIRDERSKSTRWIYPLLASGVAFCIYWATLDVAPPAFEAAWVLLGVTGFAGLTYALGHLWSQASGDTFFQRLGKLRRLFFDKKALVQAVAEFVSAMVAGFVTGLLLRFLFGVVFPPGQLTASVLSFESLICFGVPLFMLVFFAEGTLLVGVATRAINDHDREWWGRCVALVLLTGFLWMCGSLIAIILPVVVAQLPQIIAPLGGVSAIVTWVIGRVVEKRTKEELETSSGVMLRRGLQIAAVMTAAILLAVLSLGISKILGFALQKSSGLQTLLFTTIFGGDLNDLTRLHLQTLAQSRWWAPAFGTAAAVVALVMSVLLEVNTYSMHSMYRNRLIRAYLGASRWFRRPDPFTGFDAQDNVDMFELRPNALWTSSYVHFDKFVGELVTNQPGILAQFREKVRNRVEAYHKVKGPQKPSKDEIRSEVTRELNELMAKNDIANGVPAPPSPAMFAKNRKYLDQQFKPWLLPSSQCARPPLHVLNTSLNLVRGDNLAWQERKADSFTISPLHIGNRRLGYRDAFEYADSISLGTALAISGAAVSPNMGVNSSPAFTFLMTLFNARLGWWLGNPAGDKFKNRGPRTTLTSLLSELTGNTNDTSDYVFLSDGGHFDNLGLYEMVRRRCRFIVVSDATADGKYAFSDLGSAVRKIRIDMGIPIALWTTYLPPSADESIGRYCALGWIEYGNVDDTPDDRRFGYLLYIKPAVNVDCPPDVRNYKRERESFPHEPTFDQFFCESQFESYRALGRHIIGKICDDKIGSPANQAASLSELFTWAETYATQRVAPPMKVKLVP